MRRMRASWARFFSDCSRNLPINHPSPERARKASTKRSWISRMLCMLLTEQDRSSGGAGPREGSLPGIGHARDQGDGAARPLLFRGPPTAIGRDRAALEDLTKRDAEDPAQDARAESPLDRPDGGDAAGVVQDQGAVGEPGGGGEIVEDDDDGAAAAGLLAKDAQGVELVAGVHRGGGLVGEDDLARGGLVAAGELGEGAGEDDALLLAG